MFLRAAGLSFLFTLLPAVGPLRAEESTARLPTVVVTADRLPSEAAGEPFATTTLALEELRAAPQLRLDDLLRNASPGFSLFRRSSSRVANPTAQGVSLRNLGPNGAGRTLVLLDGLPLNDPFAGWVPWSRGRSRTLRECRALWHHPSPQRRMHGKLRAARRDARQSGHRRSVPRRADRGGAIRPHDLHRPLRDRRLSRAASQSARTGGHLRRCRGVGLAESARRATQRPHPPGRDRRGLR